LLKHEKLIQEKVFWATAQLLNLTVDLIFFDTTNTYFEMDDPGDSELLAFGKSKRTFRTPLNTYFVNFLDHFMV